MRFVLVFIISFLSTTGYSQTGNARLNNMLAQSKIVWKQYQTSHFNFFVEENKYADENIAAIKKDVELQRTNITNFLGDTNYVNTANVIIVDTKEKMNKVLGFDAQGFAIPENDIVIFLHSKDYSLASKHELTHYYSFHIWGKPADNWFSEGLAVYYDNKWNGHQIDSLAKHLKDNNKLFNMAMLGKKFYSLNAMIAYPQIGSFVSYLLSTYGKATLKELWVSGLTDIKSIYKKSLKALEAEWLSFLDTIQPLHIDYAQHLANPTR